MRSVRNPRFLPLGILLLGCALAGWLGLRQQELNETIKTARFATLRERTLNQVMARLDMYEDGLRGARGAIFSMGSSALSRERFRDYVTSLDVPREFPGALGFGFAQRVPKQEEHEFLRAARADGYPNFEIEEFRPHDGERFVVRYFEPLEHNERAIGLDIASEATRRATARTALTTKQTTLTPPIELLQTTGPPKRGFLMLLAVYSAPPEGKAESHVGWVYTPLRTADIFKEFGLVSNDYALRLTDVTQGHSPLPIFASRDARSPSSQDLFSVVLLRIGGRTWSLEMRARPSFVASLPISDPWLAALRVVAFVCLLSGLLYMYLAGLERDLYINVERERLADIVESSDDAIVSKTLDGIITSWNGGAARMFGFTKEEIVGRPIEVLLLENASQEHQRLAAIARGEAASTIETVRVAKDGSQVHVALTVSAIRDHSGKIVGASSVARDISERKRAEETLRQSERRFRALLESTPHLVWSSDPKGSGEYFSPQWTIYTGARESELLGVQWFEYVHPDDIPGASAKWWAANERHEPFDTQYRIRRHDGAYRWFKVRAAQVSDESGKVIKWFGSSTDIQDLRDAQESLSSLNQDLEARVLMRTDELRAANDNLAVIAERLQLATWVAAMGVWDWDVQNGVFVADETMRNVYHLPSGVTAEAPEYWWAFVYPPDRKLVDAAFSDALTGDKELDVGYRIVRRDTQIRHIRTTAATHRDESGRPLRMVGVNWDITEQRTAELLLQSSEALQRVILDAAGSAIVATDANGLITRFNPAAEALTGYSADEVVGRASASILHEASEIAARRRDLEDELGMTVPELSVLVMRSRKGRADTGEWTYVRKDGSHVPILLTMTTMRDVENHIFGYLGVAVDLTDRKRHETELLTLNRMLEERSRQAESASRAKGMFLANMSHEIRTPMNAITGVTYLLGKTDLSPEQRDLLRTVQGASKVLLSMINDVLDLSKIEAQQFALEIAPFSLLRVLDDVAAFMAGYATHKRLELVIDAPLDLPDFVRGDAVRLTQVLTNLTNNAIKFTTHGSVTLHVRLESNEHEPVQLRFEVSDTGMGMDSELVAKLFTPFTQADETSTRRVGGTGLGLSIVKELVRLMDGEVFVHSTLGVGSTLGCIIPFEPSDYVDEARAPELSLLVADDHPGQRNAIAQCAERLHWKVKTAGSWKETFQHLQDSEKGAFDLAIVDWKMEGSDGWEQAHALRKAIENHGEVLIVATDYDASARRQQGDFVVHAVLAKPVTSASLLDAVSAAHSRRPHKHRFSAPRAEMEEAERLVGARVLVVDDSEVNLDVARKILEIQGAHVRTASGGNEAVALVTDGDQAFDVILMDIQMPDVDGLEATRRIRELDEFKDLPIIALSAGALVSEQARALAVGMNDFISKPFDPVALVSRVREHAERARKSPLPIPIRTMTPKANPIPSVPTQQLDADWPTVDGIDTKDAQARLAGDVQLFDGLLARLLTELISLRTAHLPLPEDPNRTALGSHLHRLRGSAGNLGAVDLHEAATRLEEALRAREEARFETLWHLFQRELERVVRAGQEYLHGREHQKQAMPEGASPALLDPETLATFVRLLAEQNLDALSLFDTVGASLLQELGPAEGPLLRSAVENLDFPRALALVTKLRVG